jgi:hypothetical protein
MAQPVHRSVNVHARLAFAAWFQHHLRDRWTGHLDTAAGLNSSDSKNQETDWHQRKLEISQTACEHGTTVHRCPTMTIALVERGRRAVYHALSLVLSDRANVLRAFEVWEVRFANPDGFRVTLYVNTLAKAELLREAQVRALSSALYAAMIMPEEDLPHVPAEMRARKAPAPVAATTPRPPTSQPRSAGSAQLVIFSSLMAALIDSVRRMRKLDQFVAALRVQQPRVSQATLSARASWIESALANSQQFAGNVPQSERRSVLNDLYLALRDACGRADADAVIAIAVRSTEQVAQPHGSTWQQLSRS